MPDPNTKVTAGLKNWKQVTYCGVQVVTGYIYGDTKQRWPDGTFIRSSFLQDQSVVLKQGDTAITNNSAYFLGAPAEEA